ncbi:phospholipid/cholesterol/gamma-HCH transport system substrate-binding protein [Aquimarina amphilecti]|uniref:Phospholipid/cholesterol/gamma-HCH transport system substrate-binding protein n=1 Tax=Aquimarina amphilecti TaxID=1038014 RepID=A0A1H7M7F1_AQUAM|nr:MlaD family protein [Aquimarina amphilecti]SEL07051.1 phospholipid/cholesterol/gamma-HCH transport system substrate-binding protein [Aquimarina amphilecti]
MEKSVSQKLKLGVFTVLGTLLLVAALYFVGNKQHLFSSNIRIKSQFANVNGLEIGNNVRYSGINVGTVSSIEMIGDYRIMVEMMIQESIIKHIKKDAVATIGSDGLVGNMIINIIPRESKLSSIISGDTIQSYSRIGSDDMLTTLNVTNENAALLTADLLKITTKVIDGKGTLGLLINDSTMAQDLKQTIFQLKKTSSGASNVINELNKIISSINKNESVAGVLLSDSISGKKMKTIVSNLEQSSFDINKITKNLDSALTNVVSGKGALHYLTEDESLVKKIDTTINNIKEGTDLFNKNMEALKHNFFFRGYFKKLEKEEKKKDN